MRISPAAVNADDANTTRRTVSIHDERHNHRTTPAASSAGTMSEGRLTIVVVALSILTFLGILSETSLNIAYSTLMGEFAISADVVQWLTTGYLLLLSIAIPTSPFMVRTFPTKGLFVTAVALFSAGTVVGALAVNFPMLLAARLIMALGTGVSLPLLTNIILEKAPFNRRGMMLGLVSLVTCAAPAIGPVFGGLVMEFLNWHWIFYTMIPFLILSLVLGCATVPDIRHGGKGYLSVPSLILVAIGLAGIIVAVSFFAQWNGDWRFWTVLAGAIVVLGVFAAVQLKMEHPLVEVRTFAFPGFTLGMLILLMSSGGVLGVNFLLPILLQRGLGHSSMIAALILLPGAVVGAISAPLIGGALKAHFPPKFIACGFVGVAIMDIVMMLGGAHEWAVAIAYALFMAASGFVLVPDQNGEATHNSLCADTTQGNAETYLTTDVVNWAKKMLPVAKSARMWAMGGFSQGGTCTTQLVPRHPDIYGAMLPVDGELKPTNGSVAKMVQEYFAGDRKAYDEQVPVNAIAATGTPEQALFTGAGERDKESISNMRTIADAARKAGMEVTELIVPGTGHDWHAVQAVWRPGLDWFGERTGLGEMTKSLKEYPQVEVLQ